MVSNHKKIRVRFSHIIDHGNPLGKPYLTLITSILLRNYPKESSIVGSTCHHQILPWQHFRQYPFWSATSPLEAPRVSLPVRGNHVLVWQGMCLHTSIFSSMLILMHGLVPPWVTTTRITTCWWVNLDPCHTFLETRKPVFYPFCVQRYLR